MEILRIRKEPLRRSTLTTTDIFFKKDSPGYIPPDAHVLVVGPGVTSWTYCLTLPMDNSLVVLPPYLSKGGKITVLDAPQGVDGFGYHGIDAISWWVNYMAKFMPVCPVDFVEGILPQDVLDPNTQFDCINDHLTTQQWIMNDKRFLDKWKVVNQVLRVYKEHLRTNGKINMFYGKRGEYDYTKEQLLSFLGQEGFAVKEIAPLIDNYTAPSPLIKKLKQEKLDGILDERRELRSFYKADGIIIAAKK